MGGGQDLGRLVLALDLGAALAAGVFDNIVQGVARGLDALVVFSTPEEKVIVLSSYNTLPPTRLTDDDFHWIYPVHSVTKNVWR